MGSNIDCNTVKSRKNNSMRYLDTMLEGCINSNDDKHLKKANLISYWLREFTDYIKREDDFDPGKLIRYSRGDVIRVNFGFRIGAEFGGLHFAVVIEKNNAHSSKVVTVVPLSSTDGKKIRNENVDLGRELYEKANAQQENLLQKARSELDQTKKLLTMLKAATNENLPEGWSQTDYDNTMQDIIKRSEYIDGIVKKLSKNEKELERMKFGSMAIINQVTTISKQRIYTPKRSEDFLYHVSLSDTSLNKINEKLKEKYIF